MKKTGPSPRKTLLWILLIIVGIFIYAYGFDVTDVSIREMRIERRQENFVRILRALAQPDIFEYDQTEVVVEQPILVPCQPGITLPDPDTSGPYMVINPPCAEPNSEITINGFGFAPSTTGPLNFIPPSGVTLQLGNFTTDGTGQFEAIVKLPRRQPVAEPQTIRAITRENVGAPHLSHNGRETWNKIVETVFLALLATTIGTLLAIPISFLAAANLMEDVTSPAASIALSIIAWPLGILAGLTVVRGLSNASERVAEEGLVNLIGVVVLLALIWLITRWALPQAEVQIPRLGLRLARLAALLVAGVMGVLAVLLLSNLATQAGAAMARPLGAFGFLGTFVSDLGDIFLAITGLVVALAFGGLVASFAGRLGQFLTERLPIATLKLVNLALAALSGALLFAMIGGIIEWLYQIGNPLVVYWLPALAGALVGLLIAWRAPAKESLPVGLAVYYVVRTILNALRSIEAFIMAIIFVVLVSTGPFAGVLALSLHTVASLAKLYSEQVESILPGPLEAIKATGANRLQTIIYAVIPQIVPPYISFTMYRWDINVRMSTIIGFAGGGGIGFLLSQNIGLLNYRAAAAQMLAITIVVAVMDYISSAMRQRVV